MAFPLIGPTCCHKQVDIRSTAQKSHCVTDIGRYHNKNTKPMKLRRLKNTTEVRKGMLREKKAPTSMAVPQKMMSVIVDKIHRKEFVSIAVFIHPKKNASNFQYYGFEKKDDACEEPLCRRTQGLGRTARAMATLQRMREGALAFVFSPALPHGQVEEALQMNHFTLPYTPHQFLDASKNCVVPFDHLRDHTSPSAPRCPSHLHT